MEGCAAELGEPLHHDPLHAARDAPVDRRRPLHGRDAHGRRARDARRSSGMEKAWAIGHSWGGHLALHLAVAHPDRLYGDRLHRPARRVGDVAPRVYRGGASARSSAAEERARVEEIEERSEAGEVTEEEVARAVEDPLAGTSSPTRRRRRRRPCRARRRRVHRATRSRRSRSTSTTRTLRKGLPAVATAGAVRPRHRGPAADPRLTRDREADPRRPGRRGSRAAATSRGSSSPASSTARCAA